MTNVRILICAGSLGDAYKVCFGHPHAWNVGHWTRSRMTKKFGVNDPVQQLSSFIRGQAWGES